MRLRASAKSSASSANEPEEDEAEELPEFIAITDVLDLHGTPVEVIPEMLRDFIDNAIELKLRRLQIIHGKGKSKLKHLVYQQLQTDKRVLRFYDAPLEMGGWGRTIVEISEGPAKG